MPAQGRSSVAARPFTVASPILRPVKLPGPLAAAKRLTSSNENRLLTNTWSICFRRVLEWEVRSSPTAEANSSFARVRQTLPRRVAVSRLRIIELSGIANEYVRSTDYTDYAD